MDSRKSNSLDGTLSDLSIAASGLGTRAESLASDASYRSTETQAGALLSIAGELRNLSAEIEALR